MPSHVCVRRQLRLFKHSYKFDKTYMYLELRLTWQSVLAIHSNSARLASDCQVSLLGAENILKTDVFLSTIVACVPYYEDLRISCLQAHYSSCQTSQLVAIKTIRAQLAWAKTLIDTTHRDLKVNTTWASANTGCRSVALLGIVREVLLAPNTCKEQSELFVKTYDRITNIQTSVKDKLLFLYLGGAAIPRPTWLDVVTYENVQFKQSWGIQGKNKRWTATNMCQLQRKGQGALIWTLWISVKNAFITKIGSQ